MAKQAPRPNHGGIPRSLKITVLAIVAVAVLFLSAFALSQQPKVEGAGTVPTLPTPTSESIPEPAPEPEVPAYVSPVMQRLLAVGTNDGHVLRATMGVCPEPLGGLKSVLTMARAGKLGSLLRLMRDASCSLMQMIQRSRV